MSLRPSLACLALALLAPASGCGPATIDCVGGCLHPDQSGGGPADGFIPTGAVNVMPAQATVVANGAAGQQAFTATDDNGHDITASCAWRVSDPSLGGISLGGLFTTAWPLPHGGSLTVIATCGNATGSAAVSVELVTSVVDPSAPTGAATGFTGPPSMDPNERPLIVYPLDGTMLARNINQLELQWRASTKDKLFHIRVVGGSIDSSFYVGSSLCANGTDCRYPFADKDWQTIALSASGAMVTITVDGTAALGAAVASAKPVKANFSPEDVKGGLYYFSTSLHGLERLPFGASQATPFITGSTACVGCHAVSRDGKKVSAVFGGADGLAAMVDGANGNQYLLPPDATRQKYVWNFETFSPDAKQMITNWAGKLQLRDGTTGQLIMDIPQNLYGAKEAVMPEWSPDGKSIVFIGIPPEGYIGKDMPGLSFLAAGDWILGNGGSVMVMPFNNGSFGQANAVVPSVALQEYNFYPSWSPDSQWIVFATGTYPGNSPTAAANGVNTTNKCMSYDQDTARLRMVSAAGGKPIELTAATHAANRTSSWPKFAPFVQANGSLVFITFSAKFAYGFVVPDKARPQIWMSAIDLGRAAQGAADPSYPPFWLPFQDPTQNNHETIWTEEVACNSDGDCPAEFICEMNACVPKVG
jgi:hypothetical protein